MTPPPRMNDTLPFRSLDFFQLALFVAILIRGNDIMIEFVGPESHVVKMTDRVTDRVTDIEQQILMCIIDDPNSTMLQIAEKVKVSRKTVGKYLRTLKDKGIIERVGSDRKGYWKTNIE